MWNARMMLVLLTGAFGVVSSPQLVNNQVPAVLERMQSSELAEREAALGDLCKLAANGTGKAQGADCTSALSDFFRRHPEQVEVTTVALIKLLKTENETFMDDNVAPGTYNDADSEHYSKLIDIVASLNDERSIPSLVGAITTGALAEQGLLKYGSKALGPVLDQFHSSRNAMVRSESLAMAVTILLKRNDVASYSKVGELIQSGLQDKDFLLRIAAIQAIERLDDGTPFVQQLQVLAERDPLKIVDQASQGEDDYPVRQEARRALDRMAKQRKLHDSSTSPN